MEKPKGNEIRKNVGAAMSRLRADAIRPYVCIFPSNGEISFGCEITAVDVVKFSLWESEMK